MDKEIWKDIEGYEKIYQVSNLGRIRSSKNTKYKILKVSTDSGGYNFVGIQKKGVRKQILVHRAVAIAFIPNPEAKPQVNHKNGIKSDNRVDNLEWATKSENQKHAYAMGLHKKIRTNAKLSDKAAETIRKSYIDGMTMNELAKVYGVSKVAIWQIVHNITYKNEV